MDQVVDKCRLHTDKLDDLHEDLKSVVAYIPKIELALSKMIDIQDDMRHHASIHKDLYEHLRRSTQELADMRVQYTALEGRVALLEDSRKGALSMLTPIVSWLLIGALSVLAGLAVARVK